MNTTVLNKIKNWWNDITTLSHNIFTSSNQPHSFHHNRLLQASLVGDLMETEQELTVAVIESNAVFGYLMAQNIKGYTASLKSRGVEFPIYVELYKDEIDFHCNAIDIPQIIIQEMEDQFPSDQQTVFKRLMIHNPRKLITPDTTESGHIGNSICHQIEHSFKTMHVRDEDAFDLVIRFLEDAVSRAYETI